jgi:hypothetical protein
MDRMSYFYEHETVLLTNSAYFVEKTIDIGPEIEFLIGADVALKLLKDHDKEFIEKLIFLISSILFSFSFNERRKFIFFIIIYIAF